MRQHLPLKWGFLEVGILTLTLTLTLTLSKIHCEPKSASTVLQGWSLGVQEERDMHRNVELQPAWRLIPCQKRLVKRCKYSIDAPGIDLFPDLFVSWRMARIQKDEAAALSHTGRAGGKRQKKNTTRLLLLYADKSIS